ncbi:MAG: T9SS type A sorting domain-containing protein [Fidelibacterota bacterium]
MMKSKLVLTTMMIVFSFTTILLAQIQSNMYYRGEMNAWGTTAMTFRDLGTDSWFVTIQSDGDDSVSEFKFDNETNWAGNDWSSENTSSVVVGVKDDFWRPNNGSNGNFNEQNSKYYTFIFKDVNTSSHSEGYIFEFDGSPVSISHFDDSGTGGDNTPFDFESADSIQFKIDCGTSQPPADQKFYVRYYFDADNVNGYVGWSSANIVGTTTTAYDGANYYALITVSTPDNASTVYYYTLTTESGISLTNSNVDLATVYFDNNSGANYSNSINGGSLANKPNFELPTIFSISEIYPNPFNPQINIKYSIDVASNISIEIYDLNGNQVGILYDGYSLVGNHSLAWKPSHIASGVYIVQFKTPGQKVQRQITYLK